MLLTCFTEIDCGNRLMAMSCLSCPKLYGQSYCRGDCTWEWLEDKWMCRKKGSFAHNSYIHRLM